MVSLTADQGNQWAQSADSPGWSVNCTTRSQAALQSQNITQYTHQEMYYNVGNVDVSKWKTIFHIYQVDVKR